MADEHRGLVLVGGLYVQSELFLLGELSRAILLLAPEYFLPVTGIEYPVNVFLVSIYTVLALELFPADVAGNK